MEREPEQPGLVINVQKSGAEFKIYVDSNGKIHLPLDFPNKQEFIDSIPCLDISDKLKKSGGFCG